MITRAIVILLALGALFAGPVSACVCADDHMAAMPCCPDQPQDVDHLDFGLPSTARAVCDPAQADLLPAGPLDLPAPVAIAASAHPAWLAHGPPGPGTFLPPRLYDAPPVYLLTLRFRE